MGTDHPLLEGHPLKHWRRSTRRRFAARPESHDLLVVLLVIRGRMNYLIDGQVVGVERGSLLFAHAGQAHVLLSETRNFDMWVVLASEPALAAEGLPPFAVPEGFGQGPRRIGEAGCAELEQMAQGLAETAGDAVRCDGLRYWLARAWALWCKADTESGAHLHPAIESAVLALKADLTLGATALAERSGIRTETLGRLFRAQMGESLVEFRNRARLEAVDRIAEGKTARNLTDAALEAGFGSYAQFFRVFQALRGMAPHAYYQEKRGPFDEQRTKRHDVSGS